MTINQTIMQIIIALGGLGLFLYGMRLMGEGLELAAGSNLRSLLEKLTTNRFLGALVGIVVTAIIQSSTAVSVMCVGFVNASIMTLNQAMGVIMGATIGTTVTSVLLSIQISDYAPIAIFIGAIMVMLSKKNNTKYFGQIIAGFGILFYGMSTMSEHLEPLAQSEFFSNIITSVSNPFIGIIFGIAFAAILQSSSAAVGVLHGLWYPYRCLCYSGYLSSWCNKSSSENSLFICTFHRSRNGDVYRYISVYAFPQLY